MNKRGITIICILLELGILATYLLDLNIFNRFNIEQQVLGAICIFIILLFSLHKKKKEKIRIDGVQTEIVEEVDIPPKAL